MAWLWPLGEFASYLKLNIEIVDEGGIFAFLSGVWDVGSVW